MNVRQRLLGFGHVIPPVLIAVACLAATGVLQAVAQPNPTYDVIALGTPGSGMIDPVAINSRGVIAGTLGAPGRHAATWSHGQIRDLGTLPGDTTSAATAINDAGQVVGYSQSADGATTRAFLWSGTSMRQIGPATATDCRPAALTKHGEILLVIWDAVADGHRCMIWSTKGTRDTGVISTQTAAMENQHTIVAAVRNSGPGIGHAIRWNDGKVTDLGMFPLSTESVPTAIAGKRIVGYSKAPVSTIVGRPYAPSHIVNRNSRTAGGNDHACIWQAGTLTDLGALSSQLSVSEALGVNHHGTIVGWSAEPDLDGPLQSPHTAVVWIDGTIHDLNARIAPGSNVILQEARAVNDRGYVVVSGRAPRNHGAFTLAGFLLVPRPLRR